MASQQQPHVNLLAFHVSGSELERLLKCLLRVCLRIVRDVGSFPRSARQRDRELVVTGELARAFWRFPFVRRRCFAQRERVRFLQRRRRRSSFTELGVWAATQVARVKINGTINFFFFMAILISMSKVRSMKFGKNRGRCPCATATWMKRLVNRANSARLSAASSLAGTNVDRVASIIGGHDERER